MKAAALADNGPHGPWRVTLSNGTHFAGEVKYGPDLDFARVRLLCQRHVARLPDESAVEVRLYGEETVRDEGIRSVLCGVYRNH